MGNKKKNTILPLIKQVHVCHMRDVTVLLAVVLMFLLIQMYFNGLGRYLWKQKEWMNVCEMYILVAGSQWTQNAWLPCMLLWWTGRGIQGRGMETKLIRSSRGAWYWANVVMICLDSLIFCMFTFVSSLLVCGRSVRCTAGWSDFLMKQNGVMTVPWLSSVNLNMGMLQKSTPWKMAVVTLLLQVILVILVAVILFLFRLMKKVVPGYMLICLIWIWDLLIRQDYLRGWAGYLSPLTLGRSGTLNWGYNEGKPAVGYAVTVMLFMTVILIIIGRFIMRYCDLADYMNKNT